ncbi:MAG: CTP synthase, partial [Candidatus Pacebacteria bacterium]|nr:CTP synthase [Candidatus Paceibacterota bacterium]
IEIIKYARENNIPFLGLSAGFYLALIEYAENVHQLKTNLFLKTKMQLGVFNCKIKKGTKSFEIYKKTSIEERHRHLYDLKENTPLKGLTFAGFSNNSPEIIELENHPFFIACKFHPQFKSRPLDPHPLFKALVKSIIH